MSEMEREFKRLGNEIRRRRKARNMSIEDVSNIASLTPVTIQRVENGQYDLPVADLLLIAVALGCEAHELFTAENDVMTEAMPEIDAEDADDADDADEPTLRRLLN